MKWNVFVFLATIITSATPLLASIIDKSSGALTLNGNGPLGESQLIISPELVDTSGKYVVHLESTSFKDPNLKIQAVISTIETNCQTQQFRLTHTITIYKDGRKNEPSESGTGWISSNDPDIGNPTVTRYVCYIADLRKG